MGRYTEAAEINRRKYNEALELMTVEVPRLMLSDPMFVAKLANETGLPESYIKKVAIGEVRGPHFDKLTMLGAAAKRLKGLSDEPIKKCACTQMERIAELENKIEEMRRPTYPTHFTLVEKCLALLKRWHNAGYTTQDKFINAMCALHPEYTGFPANMALVEFYLIIHITPALLDKAEKALLTLKPGA